MNKVGFYTLGCKVNQFETNAIRELFEDAGYQVVDFSDKADVYVINTCTVTSLSDRKSRQAISRAKKANKDSIIVVIGCYSQIAPDEISKIPEVSLILGTQQRRKILEYISKVRNGEGKIIDVNNIMESKQFENLTVHDNHERTRAFLKIQEGCNQFCTYCIIPYARGGIRSQEGDLLVQQAEELTSKGFKELVLTGTHIASYGKDKENTSLINLLYQLNELPNLERIRLGSLDPKILTSNFINQIKKIDKLCPHFHVSLQSGCNETLKRMGRKYTTEEYKNSICTLRENISDISITTDVIVGFPGETDQEFEATCKFVEDIKFASMHIFKYSRRKGTKAYDFKDQVSPQKKDERSKVLIELGKKLRHSYNDMYIGRILPVLFEQYSNLQENYLEGLTENYIKVICEEKIDLTGLICNVKLIKNETDYITGQVLYNESIKK